jgi:alkanesulfonate monooxygenase SsuD/methylene tetrahydromethanopterin reductase-like flavin-dependent oxidoreductase (luciferase family)
VVAGTPKTIADRKEEWFLARGTDGFPLVRTTLPGGLPDFVAEVVPEPQRRALFRRSYEGRTCARTSACRSRTVR